MKRLFIIAAALLVVPLPSFSQEVLPEVPAVIELSSSDVNRVSCSEPIQDVVSSEEKGVKVQIVDRNAFIKFLVKKEGSRDIYSTTPTEFYVVCGGEVYTIIAYPKRIPAQTVRLSSKKKRIMENLTVFEGLPFEKKVLDLIMRAYRNDLPESFTVKEVGKEIELFRELSLHLKREISVEGEALRLREFTVRLKDDVQSIELHEGDFLRKELSESPLAISLDRLLLKKGEEARLFVVERSHAGKD